MTTVAALSALAVPVTLVAATAGGSPLDLASAVQDREAASQLIRTQDAGPAVPFAGGAVAAGTELTTTFVEGETAAVQGIVGAAVTPAVAAVIPSTTVAPTTTVAPATTTTTAPPAPAVAASGTYADPADPATWDRLANCESGGNWSINTGNGYYGGLQFSLATWRSVGGTGRPNEHSRETQIAMGQRLQSRAGWGQWPHCTKRLGYR